MAAEIESLIKDLTSQINAFKPQVEAVDVGEVLEVGDGIARVSGLTNVQSNELVEFAERRVGHRVQPGRRARGRDHSGRVRRY